MDQTAIQRLSEIITIGTHKKLEYTNESYYDLLKVLSANGNDSIIGQLVKEYKLLFNETDNDKALAIHSINNYIDNYFTRIDEFIIKRKERERRPNSYLSRIAELRYKKNKSAIKKGLSKFHQSSKGKAFHRALGRFVSRNSEGGAKKAESLGGDLHNMHVELAEVMVAGNSALTQLFIHYKDELISGIVEIDKEVIADVVEIYKAVLDDFSELLMIEDAVELDKGIDEVSGDLINLFTDSDVVFK